MIAIISHFYKLIQLLFLIIFRLLDIIEEKRRYQPVPDDSKSSKYQKFKLDKAPIVIKPQVVDYLLLLEYYKLRYKKIIRPIKRKRPETEPEKHVKCPRCEAPHNYIYKNNGKKGCPYDNAVAEATYKVFKTEFVYNQAFESLEHLKIKLFEYINWYNNFRIHGSLDYLTPVEYKKRCREKVV